MDINLVLQASVVSGLILFIWLSTKLIAWLKTRKNNVPLWADVFEGLTHGLVRMDDYIKEPEFYIERKTRRDGKEIDPEKIINPEEAEQEK